MTLIRGGRLIDPKTNVDKVADILLESGRIVQIAGHIPAEGCEIIDATGLVVAPGLVDTHVHFREPGFTHKEDIDTGAAAAKRGGFTTVVCMANTNPPVDSVDTLRRNIERGAATGIHVLQAAAVTVGMKGEALTDMETLCQAGAVGFSDDGLPLLNAGLVRAAMERAKSLGVTLSFHEEDASLIGSNGVNEGAVSRKLGLPGSPACAEDVLVARDCMLALHTGARVVIQHISSAWSVAMVRFAKGLGADVHAEATPHHFSLTEEAVLKYGAMARMNPPLRTAADREAIVEGLRDGTIDIIATDHAPHTAEEKAVPFAQAPSGIIGLETALSLGITHLVRTGALTLPQLLAKMTANPAACYGLNAGSIYVGGPADLVLFDESIVCTMGYFVSKSSNSPFIDHSLHGKILKTICNNAIAHQD